MQRCPQAEIKTTNDCIDRGGGVHDAFACASRQACKINGKIICLESETPSTVSPSQGPQGVPGPAGATGPSGLSGYEVIYNIQNGALQVGGNVDLVATCPTGKKVLGGGYVVPSVSDTAPLSRTEPGNTAWRVSFHSNGGSGAVSVYAICAFVN